MSMRAPRMTRERFEEVAQRVFDDLPELFGDRVDNVSIVVEDLPDDDICRQMRVKRRELLGLYQGIPLTERGSWYGMAPTMPDRIFLFQDNIEADCEAEEELEGRIQEVLLHELGHYFGMSESQIRKAMKRFFR
jgi:predicted Zn-dependent protease with MMP-like domain